MRKGTWEPGSRGHGAREPGDKRQAPGARDRGYGRGDKDPGSPGTGAKGPRSPGTGDENPGSPGTRDRGPESLGMGNKDLGGMDTGTGEKGPGFV